MDSDDIEDSSDSDDDDDVDCPTRTSKPSFCKNFLKSNDLLYPAWFRGSLLVCNLTN